VLVLGAGPAGLAAAIAASKHGAAVTVVDALPEPGGQIWRGQWRGGAEGDAARCFEGVRSLPIGLLLRTRVVSAPAPGVLAAEGLEGPLALPYDRLVLATGARERFLPFPGWTLPGVAGAGGLQAMVKGGLDLRGKRVVVAGSGPLLLAVGAQLKKAGAKVVAIAEQAPLSRLLTLGASLLARPSKLAQALSFSGLPVSTGSWVVRAEGEDRLRRVLVHRGGRESLIDCDHLACGFGLVPALEAAQMMGCGTKDGSVTVDACQRTSVPDIFAAGESTGVGGVEKALVEGRIAGLAAADREPEALALAPRASRERAFVARLESAFALRPELRALPDAETLVCRCEDVPFGALRSCERGRDARLHLRCGMGPCQARVCGPATAFLFGWEPGGPRIPLFPAPAAALLVGAEPSPLSQEHP
jgi:NADPH-dependent 2,4-dienoyl-CoA reductase/sulfur reductase-like enzyme